MKSLTGFITEALIKKHVKPLDLSQMYMVIPFNCTYDYFKKHYFNNMFETDGDNFFLFDRDEWERLSKEIQKDSTLSFYNVEVYRIPPRYKNAKELQDDVSDHKLSYDELRNHRVSQE